MIAIISKLTKLNIIVLIISIITIISCNKSGKPYSLSVGDSVPTFDASLSTGGNVMSSQIRTGWCLISFFNVGCPDCQKSLPELEEAYRAHHDEVLFIPIDRDEAQSEVQAYWAEHGFSMPFALDNGRSIYRRFCERGVPRYYLSHDGVIVRIWNEQQEFSCAILSETIRRSPMRTPAML